MTEMFVRAVTISIVTMIAMLVVSGVYGVAHATVDTQYYSERVDGYEFGSITFHCGDVLGGAFIEYNINTEEGTFIYIIGEDQEYIKLDNQAQILDAITGYLTILEKALSC